MNKNKILIELEIPLIEKKYDLFIPINKKIGTIKDLIEQSLIDLTDNGSISNAITSLTNGGILVGTLNASFLSRMGNIFTLNSKFTIEANTKSGDTVSLLSGKLNSEEQSIKVYQKNS